MITLRFRDTLPPNVVDELDSVLGKFKGLWLVEHDQDGSHTDIHAHSVSVTKDTTKGWTGDVTAGGSGSFGGDVVALAGSGRDTGMGSLNALSATQPLFDNIRQGMLLLAGMTKGNAFVRRLRSGSFFGGTAVNQLSLWDFELSTIAPIIQIGDESGVAAIIDGGGASPGLQIGNNARPVSSVRAGVQKFFEGGRTSGMGQWYAYTPTIQFGLGNFIVLGNGGLFGFGMDIGNTTFYRISFFPGTTTVLPGLGGGMIVSLPQTAGGGGLQPIVGQTRISDASTGAIYSGLANELYSATQFLVYRGGEPSPGVVTDLGPIVIANGDWILMSGWYDRV